MLRRLLTFAGLLSIGCAGGYLVLTVPSTWTAMHAARDIADYGAPDLFNGRSLFYVGSCSTCHVSPDQMDGTRLGGGLPLTSGFGTFYMPNISPDPVDGIGAWTTEIFVRAMREGVSPHGENEYPAFPYTSFQRMTANDLRDLFSFMKTLPLVKGKARDHDLKFPFTMRSGVGLWKLFFLDGAASISVPLRSPAWNRGRYLVEGPGHCAECHSPRNLAGAIVSNKRFSGAPDPEGNGYVPNITQDETGIDYWSQREIDDYLASGTTPINTQAGKSMTAVVANLAHLPPADRTAMAEYIKTLPAINSPNNGIPALNKTPTVRMLPVAVVDAKSSTSVLSRPVEAVGQATTLYAVGVKPFFLDSPVNSPTGEGDGKLLPAAKLAVISRAGKWLQVRVDGWEQEGSPAALDALKGQRILVAVLGEKAIARVVHQPSIEDVTTKLNWSPASLTVWISNDGLNPNVSELWDYSANLYTVSCGVCHAPHPTDSFLANQWIGSLKAMKRFTALDDGQYRLLQSYLQFHSKDVGSTAVGGKS